MEDEVEARFRADGGAPLARLAVRPTLGRATLGAARTVLEEDRYLDTEDGRLRALRWACRLRSREGTTRISLKGPPATPATGWLHRRPEVEGPASPRVDPEAWPESPARALLLELSGGAPLVEWLRLLQERTERPVSIDGRPVGGLTLDTVSAERGGQALGEMYLVELELRPDADPERDLPALARALAAEPGLRAEPRTKLEIALELGATA
ncbi:MAG TPA: CYTH domain-containing protein [Candidatus Limnocylindria bacterium]